MKDIEALFQKWLTNGGTIEQPDVEDAVAFAKEQMVGPLGWPSNGDLRLANAMRALLLLATAETCADCEQSTAPGTPDPHVCR